MSNKRGIQMTKQFEGFRDHIYLCPNKKLTTGWGHHLAVKSHFPKEASQILFKHDYARSEEEFNNLGLSLDPIRRIVLIDLIFNMGINSLLRFRKMLAALHNRDYVRAANELKDSKYYWIDHKGRGRAVANVNALRIGRL